jgi:hypothetical protein
MMIIYGNRQHTSTTLKWEANPGGGFVNFFEVNIEI